MLYQHCLQRPLGCDTLAARLPQHWTVYCHPSWHAIEQLVRVHALDMVPCTSRARHCIGAATGGTRSHSALLPRGCAPRLPDRKSRIATIILFDLIRDLCSVIRLLHNIISLCLLIGLTAFPLFIIVRSLSTSLVDLLLDGAISKGYPALQLHIFKRAQQAQQSNEHYVNQSAPTSL